MELLLEHDVTPGTSYDECLLYGGGGFVLNEAVNLNEAADASVKTVKFRGKFQEADAVNKNKRSYPYKVLNTNLTRLEEMMNSGGLCGELDHPTDSIVHFANASHKIVKLWWEDNVMMGEGYILNTPHGKILRSLINDGVRIGISSRGVGNGQVDENGILVIGESYKLITFDAVADPSTHAAFQKKVTSSTHESVMPTTVIDNNSQKNEASSIDTVSKEVLLACITGIANRTTNKIKARLS